MTKLTFATLIVATAAFAATAGLAQARDGERKAPFDRVCAEQSDHSHHHRLGERVAEHLNLNEAQLAAYKDFVETRTKALDDAKASLCDKKPDLSTFEQRLVFGQSLLEAKLTALKAENPKLIAFYNSLDDKQKARFDHFRQRMSRDAS